MKFKFNLFATTVLLVAISTTISCDSLGIGAADKASAVSSAPALNNYLDAYKKLRTDAPNVLKKINSQDTDLSSLGDEYQKYESIIQSAGYSGHSDFVKNNAKVGMVYSILLALMKSEVHEMNQNNMDEMAKFIQESIDDPNVPESKKAELREKLKDVNKGKQSLNRFDQNITWAKGVVKMAKRLENMSISEEDAMLLIKHEKDIKAAYDGFPMPPAVNIPHVDVDDLE
jgi:hypothetical protein